MTSEQRQIIQHLLAIRREQDKEHADTHTVPEWLLIIETQLNKAKAAWYKDGNGAGRYRIAQIGACAIACLEQNKDQTKSTP